MIIVYLGMIVLIIVFIGLILYLTQDLKKMNEDDLIIENIDYEVKYYLQDKTLLEKVIKYYIKNKKLPKNTLKKYFEIAYCDYLLQKSKKAIEADAPEIAEKHFLTFREFSPTDPLLISKFIITFYQLMGLDKAFEYIKEVLPIYSSNKEFYESIKDIMQKKANSHLAKFETEFPDPTPDQLIEQYLKLIEIYPHRVSLIKLGDLYTQKSDKINAKDYFLRAIDIPQKPDKLYKGTHHKLGMIFFDLKKYNQAIFHLLEVLRVRPSHKSVSSDLSFVCQNIGIQTYIPKLKEIYKEKGREALYEFLDEIITFI